MADPHGQLSSLLQDVFKQNLHVPIVVLRLPAVDVDKVVKSVVRGCGVRDASTAMGGHSLGYFVGPGALPGSVEFSSGRPKGLPIQGLVSCISVEWPVGFGGKEGV